MPRPPAPPTFAAPSRLVVPNVRPVKAGGKLFFIALKILELGFQSRVHLLPRRSITRVKTQHDSEPKVTSSSKRRLFSSLSSTQNHILSLSCSAVKLFIRGLAKFFTVITKDYSNSLFSNSIFKNLTGPIHLSYFFNSLTCMALFKSNMFRWHFSIYKQYRRKWMRTSMLKY